MSRPLRIEYPGAWYHIMTRGRRGEPIFSCSSDYEMFLTLLQDAAKLWMVQVNAYCLMTNHYHILLQTPLGNLSRFMRHLNGVYTQRYNRIYGYDGQLFRGRYKSILVEEDHYLLELVRYIHRNPLKAGITHHLDDYKWCSHKDYLTPYQEQGWLHKTTILDMLPQKTTTCQTYLDFVCIDNSDETVGGFASKRWPAILGSDDFISSIKKDFSENKRHREVPDSVQLAPERRQILNAVCLHYSVTEKQLLKGRRGVKNEPRDVAIYLCRTLRNDTLIELSYEFGMSGYSPAGSAVQRIKKKLSTNSELLGHINEIKRSLYSTNAQNIDKITTI